MAIFMDLKGTSQTSLQLSKGGPKITYLGGFLQIKDNAGTGYIDLVAKILKATSNTLELNTNAAGAGADWKLILARPVLGMTANVTYTFPAAPINGYVLASDGSGNLSWVAQPSTAGFAQVGDVLQATGDTTKILVAASVGKQIHAHSVVGTIKAIFDIDPLLEVGDTTNPTALVSSSMYDLSTMSIGDKIHIPFGDKLTISEALNAVFTAPPATGSIHWSIVYVLV